MKKSGVLTLLLALLLTGCSLLPLSAEEQSYKDNCQIVYDNYQDYKALQNKFYNAKYDEPDYEWQTWPTGYAITNAGNSSRAVVDAAIKKQFPWLKTLVDSYLQGLSRKDFMKEESADLRDGTLEYLAIEAFFTQMSEGSSFTLTKKILKLDNPSWKNISEPGINEVFQQFSPSDRFKDCDAALGLDEELSMAGNWDEFNLTGDTGVHLQSVLDVYIELWGCKRYGAGFVDVSYGNDGLRKCAGKDFRDTYTYTPSTELTDEEREILAEREATTQREAESPSLNTSITPLQLCGSLGAVVQTENYGELTCKFVWVNRVRALVWMRS